jgi:glycosyltransferase involved in cell wall biosynthesis
MNNKIIKSNELPFVSVCTPTFNRRPFIPNMFNCFRNQTYPKHRIEWIIVDDGTDKIKDLIESSNIHQIRYFEVDKKMTLGAKRNYMHSFARGSIIVYMDDDDYYPPERIEDAVEKLEANPQALCAGSSEIYIFFKHIQKMYKCGPYGPNHATAGTFAFRKELLLQTKYEEHASLAEERAFLKEYTIPFVQLDPMKSILVFSHEHNTYDKRKMLDNQHPNYFRECDLTVDMFIRKPLEQPIKDFFLRDIDGLLENYEPGLPKMKPDVLKQIKEIEAEREKMLKEEMEKMKNNAPIMLQRQGEEPVQLSNQEVVNMIQEQQKQLAQLAQKSGEYENMIMILQKQLIEKTKTVQELSKNKGITVSELLPSSNKKTEELENMVTMLQKQLIEKTKTIRELNNTKSVTTDLVKENGELHKMVGMLQKELVEKTIELKEYKNTPEIMTRIPIQVEDSAPTTYRSKSDPEIIIDLNAVYC